MKKLFILFTVISFSSVAQQIPDFELPIYFEDAVGNRDTIYWGFDDEADCLEFLYRTPTAHYDEKYLSPLTPFKSDLDVRFEWGGVSSVVTDLNDIYYTKKWIQCATKVDDCLQWKTPTAGYMVMHAVNYPVKMIYDHQKLNDALCTPRGALLYKNALYHLIGPYEIETVPDSMYTCLSSNDTIIFETKEQTHVNYKVLLENGDTITAPYYELIYCRDDYRFLGIDVAFCEDVLISVNDEAFANIKLYPNPTTDYINITLPHPNLQFNLFNANGQLVWQQQKVNQQQISLQHLPNGLYTFQVFNAIDKQLLYVNKLLKL